jgi:hypothetical protein
MALLFKLFFFFNLLANDTEEAETASVKLKSCSEVVTLNFYNVTCIEVLAVMVLLPHHHSSISTFAHFCFCFGRPSTLVSSPHFLRSQTSSPFFFYPLPRRLSFLLYSVLLFSLMSFLPASLFNSLFRSYFAVPSGVLVLFPCVQMSTSCICP